MKNLSIVIPTYNERENIIILIPLIEKLFNKESLEIIVVDDNSPDGTFNEVKKLSKEYKNIVPILRQKKEGIGEALKEGYNKSTGRIIISLDADMSFDLNIIFKLIEEINKGYDLVVGEKKHYTPKPLKKIIQRVVSIYGNKFISIMSGINLKDFTSNFRAIKKEVWESIETKEKTNVFLYEMIYLVHKKGFKIKNIPVEFKDREYGVSKINIIKEGIKFLLKSIKK